jgi:hypothetical protein
VYNQEDFKR